METHLHLVWIAEGIFTQTQKSVEVDLSSTSEKYTAYLPTQSVRCPKCTHIPMMLSLEEFALTQENLNTAQRPYCKQKSGQVYP